MKDKNGNKISIAHSLQNFENEIYQKLVEAQAEARSTSKRLSHDEVFSPLRQKITGYKGFS